MVERFRCVVTQEGKPTMADDDFAGPWVRYADYEALSSRLDAALKLLKEVNCDPCEGECTPEQCRYKAFLVERQTPYDDATIKAREG